MSNAMIPFGRPLLDHTEIEAVLNVLKSPILAHGPICQRFEEAFAERVGVNHAISVASCTAALHLSLYANNIGVGDEVIVPAMTHVATAHAAEYCGAKPIFVDVDPNNGNILPEGISNVVNDRTRAFIVVHYLGLPCEMDVILDMAARANAFIIEDAALAVDATYDGKKAGTLGKVGCFSFYPIKHMTSIEGGMVTTDDEELAHSIRQRKTFGYDNTHEARVKPGIYDVNVLGFNYRMNEVEAAVGLAQLPKLAKRLKIRQRNYLALKETLSELDEITVFEPFQGKAQSSCYCLNAILPRNGSINRDLVARELNVQNIGTSVHYPKPVPLMTFYREKYGYKNGQFPVSEWLAEQTISLPIAPHVPDDFATRISTAMKRAIKKAKF